jgi:hypothetical protein
MPTSTGFSIVIIPEIARQKKPAMAPTIGPSTTPMQNVTKEQNSIPIAIFTKCCGNLLTAPNKIKIRIVAIHLKKARVKGTRSTNANKRTPFLSIGLGLIFTINLKVINIS